MVKFRVTNTLVKPCTRMNRIYETAEAVIQRCVPQKTWFEKLRIPKEQGTSCKERPLNESIFAKNAGTVPQFC